MLNDAGRQLLAALRDGMRQIDGALDQVRGDELRGVVCAVGCPDLASAILADAAARVIAAHPQLRVSVTAVRDPDVAALMLRGDADVAVVTAPPDHEDLRVERLCELGRAVYAAAPLDGPPRMIVVGARGEQPDDGWPAGAPREVAGWAADEAAALAICRRGGVATVAYDVIARAHDGLVPVGPPIAARAVYLVHRKPVGPQRRADVMAEAVRGTVR